MASLLVFILCVELRYLYGPTLTIMNNSDKLLLTFSMELDVLLRMWWIMLLNLWLMNSLTRVDNFLYCALEACLGER